MLRSIQSVRAPELAWDNKADWINSEPLRLKDLRGRPVLIDFWDYTCVNCIRTLPYLKAWHERYAPLGLTIVGVHTPEFRFAARRENVEQSVKEFGIEYPVLLDNDYENWQAFANRYWPRKYLVDSEGYIVYDHAGEGAYGDTEQAIQEQIRATRPDAMLPEIMEPVRESDIPGAVCYPMTPELYAGFRRGEIGNAEGYHPNSIMHYNDTGSHYDGLIYAHGLWFNGGEFLRHARKTQLPEDYVAIRYHALEVNAVMRSTNDKPFEVVVTQDDKPADPQDKGADIQYEGNHSLLRVTEPRMYRLISNREFGAHTLKLASTSDSFELYAFTFGSCEEPAH